MDYVRRTYGVPAKRGGRVIIDDGSITARHGTITSARQGRLRVRVDGDKHPRIYHPLDLFYHDTTRSEP